MKRPAIFAITALLVVASLSITFLVARSRERQRQWPAEMNRRCQAFAGSIIGFREARGRYPESLSELVSGNVLSESELRELSFQPSPGSDLIPWRYFPMAPEGILLASPEAVVPWAGHSGFYQVAFADSSVQGLATDKWESLWRRMTQEPPSE